VALVFLGTSSDVAVLTIELASIVGSRGEAFHLLTAAAFVSMLIPLIVFLSLQRFFVRGLLAGSVKG
jgi:alpha-glucoside transport system permease protein